MTCRYKLNNGKPCRCGELCIEDGVVIGHYDCVGPPGTVGATGPAEPFDDEIQTLRFAREIIANHNIRIAETNARLDQLEAAERELKRLGYGVETIYVFNARGLPAFTSRVGDAAHDTPQNRDRTRVFIDRAERALAALQRVETTRGACEETPELHAVYEALDILRGTP